MLALSAWACAGEGRPRIIKKSAASTALEVGAKRAIRHPKLEPASLHLQATFGVNDSSVSTVRHAALETKHCFSGWAKMY